MITMIDIRRLLTCVGWRRRADLVTDLELGRLYHVLKCLPVNLTIMSGRRVN